MNRSSGNGNFSLIYSISKSLYSNDAEPNDIKENSILVQPDAIVKGHMGYNTDIPYSPDVIDFYRIDIPQNKSYVFTIDKSADHPFSSQVELGISILKTDGVTPVSEFNTIGNNFVTQQLSLNTGTYYIKITNFSGYGGYEFKMCSGN